MNAVDPADVVLERLTDGVADAVEMALPPLRPALATDAEWAEVVAAVSNLVLVREHDLASLRAVYVATREAYAALAHLEAERTEREEQTLRLRQQREKGEDEK